jgi:hypothetical protein
LWRHTAPIEENRTLPTNGEQNLSLLVKYDEVFYQSYS